MKRFRFNLEKLLDLRAYRERGAELTLAAKAGRCALLDANLMKTAESRVRTKVEEFGPGRTLADYHAAELYIIRLDRERDRLAHELALAEAEREDARLEYVEKRTARESIGKLKERRQAEYYRLASREETKQLDDLARRKIVDDAPRRKVASDLTSVRVASAEG